MTQYVVRPQISSLKAHEKNDNNIIKNREITKISFGTSARTEFALET